MKKKGHLDYIKNKTFCSSKIRRVKRQITEWKKIFGVHILDKGLISSIHKEPLHINKKKADNLIEKMVKRPSHFRLSKWLMTK